MLKKKQYVVSRTVVGVNKTMVDTRRLEQLLSKAGADRADPATAQASGKLALSGHREMRLSGRPKTPTAQRLAQIAQNWTLIDPAQSSQNADIKQKQFNTLSCDPKVTQQFDILRTQLLQAFRSRGFCSLGITAPHHGAGASFATAGLLASLARRGDLSVVALDLNLRAPRLHAYFDLDPAQPILPLLAGDVEVESHLRRITERVAIGMNSNALDYLQSSAITGEDIAELLLDITQMLAPDVIICDLPPLLDGDQAMTVVPHIDAVMVVANSADTQSADIIACERLLQGHTEFLGVVLNKSQSAPFDRRAP